MRAGVRPVRMLHGSHVPSHRLVYGVLFYIMLCRVAPCYMCWFLLFFAATGESWWNKEGQCEDLTGTSFGTLSTTVSSEGTVNVESTVPSTDDATRNTAALSLASSCSVTEGSTALLANADEIVGSTWADSMQVYILMYSSVFTAHTHQWRSTGVGGRRGRCRP